MSDISTAVQAARLRNTMAETEALLPGGPVNWTFYESAIKAVREQDATTLVRILPMLKDME